MWLHKTGERRSVFTAPLGPHSAHPAQLRPPLYGEFLYCGETPFNIVTVVCGITLLCLCPTFDGPMNVTRCLSENNVVLSCPQHI